MASAEKRTIVLAPAVAEVTATEITLKLSQEEAQVLRDITGYITADSARTRRTLTDKIYYALADLTEDTKFPRDYKGDIYFLTPGMAVKKNLDYEY